MTSTLATSATRCGALLKGAGHDPQAHDHDRRRDPRVLGDPRRRGARALQLVVAACRGARGGTGAAGPAGAVFLMVAAQATAATIGLSRASAERAAEVWGRTHVAPLVQGWCPTRVSRDSRGCYVYTVRARAVCGRVVWVLLDHSRFRYRGGRHACFPADQVDRALGLTQFPFGS